MATGRIFKTRIDVDGHQRPKLIALLIPVRPPAVSSRWTSPQPALTRVCSPIDEVLGFLEEHLAEHRLYSRAVRQFVREL